MCKRKNEYIVVDATCGEVSQLNTIEEALSCIEDLIENYGSDEDDIFLFHGHQMKFNTRTKVEVEA